MDTDSSRNRTKATHFVFLGTGLSNTQEYSIRGKVLSLIKNTCPVGELISIDDFDAQAKEVTYGGKVRGYLSKLEEAQHIRFETVEPEAEQEAETAGEDNA